MKTERIERTDMLDRFLEPGESILWEGQPNPGSWFRMGIWFPAIGAVLILAAAASYFSSTGFDLIAIIGTTFFLICGSALMLAPFLGWFAARRTFYAVTDRRVILRTPRLDRRSDLTSVYPAELTLLIRQHSRGRLGTLQFDRYHRNATWSEDPPYLTVMGLCSIEDAVVVEAIIRQRLLNPPQEPVDFQSRTPSGLIDQAISTVLDRELGEGEHLVWAQRPNARCMFKKALPFGLFGIFWLGFLIGMILFEAHRQPLSGTTQSWVVSLIVLILVGIFLAVGLGLLLSPVWFWHTARRTTYALTNQRCLIVKASAGRKRRVTSFFPPEMEYIWRAESRDGYGDVVFGRADQAQGQRSTERLGEACGFIAIENPAEIERLVRQTLSAKAQETRPG